MHAIITVYEADAQLERLGRQPIESKKIFSIGVSDEDLVFRICTELKKFNNNKI